MRLDVVGRSSFPAFLSQRQSDLPSSQETLAPATFVADSHLRPALRPRSNLSGSPSRRFDAVPGLLNAKDFDEAVNFGALSHGSVLAVYASCRRSLRLRNTRFRRVASLCRSRFRGMGFSDWFHLSFPINSSFPELRLALFAA